MVGQLAMHAINAGDWVVIGAAVVVDDEAGAVVGVGNCCCWLKSCCGRATIPIETIATTGKVE